MKFDFSDLARVAENVGATQDQIPFALSVALNAATNKVYQYLIGTTWPTHVVERNKSFIGAALRISRPMATKRNLETVIGENERVRRGNLLGLQAKGGMRTSTRGRLIVPVQDLRALRTGRGVPARLRPEALGKKLVTLPGKDGLFYKDRKGKLRLMYVLKGQTRVPKRVPFYEDFNTQMRKELYAAIPAAVERAMATRRVR